MKECLLSIIICTYNRCDLLAQCLDSIRDQRLADDLFEVIVIDNNSSDETEKTVQKHIEDSRNARYILEEKQGLSNARNRGASEAKGTYLVYLDDDDLLEGDYLANVYKTVTEKQPDIMGGPVYPFYLDKKPWWYRDRYEIKKYEQRSGFSKTCRITGCNFIIKKDILSKLGMFDPDLGMIGNTLKLGEEAKVLNDYRKMTPDNEQNVYYDLDCSVKHYVPAFKLKLCYILKRQFHSGRLNVSLNPKSIFNILLELPPRIVWYVIVAFRDGDPVGMLRNLCFQLGMIVGPNSKSATTRDS